MDDLSDDELRLLGQEILNLRTENGISAADLAAVLGRDRTVVSKIENGKQRLVLDHLFSLRTELGVSVDALIDAVRPKGNFMEREERDAHGLHWIARTPVIGWPRVFEVSMFAEFEHSLGPRRHAGSELIEVMDGAVDVQLGSTELRVHRYEVLEIPPYERHAVAAVPGRPARLRWTMTAAGEEVHTQPDPDLTVLRRWLERRAKKTEAGEDHSSP